MSGHGAHGLGGPATPYGSGALSEVNHRQSSVGAVGDTLSHAREALVAFVTVGRAQVKKTGAHGAPYGWSALFGVGCAVRTNRPYIRSLP